MQCRELKEQFNIDIRVLAIANHTKMLTRETGINLENWKADWEAKVRLLNDQTSRRGSSRKGACKVLAHKAQNNYRRFSSQCDLGRRADRKESLDLEAIGAKRFRSFPSNQGARFVLCKALFVSVLLNLGLS